MLKGTGRDPAEVVGAKSITYSEPKYECTVEKVAVNGVIDMTL